MRFQVCVLLCLAILSNVAQGEQKVLYLIRHGNSEWNSAGASKVVTDYFRHRDNLHDATLTDAPLTAKGLLDAFSVCRAVYEVLDSLGITANYKAKCANVGGELALNADITWQPKTGALDRKNGNEFPAYKSFSHAQILAGKAVEDTTPLATHVTSNLVRAIDTMFFSVFPSLVDKSISQIAATSYCQEVGGGWDGSVHSTRMKGCVYTSEDDQEANRAVCVKTLHRRQEESLKNLLGNLESSQRLSLIDNHAKFYSDILSPVPADDKHYWKYQLENEGSKRKEHSVQYKMFQDFISLIESDFATPYVVVAGHSHYFAHFVKKHSAPSDKRCQTFAEAMQDNGAIWRVNLDTTTKLISNCKIVYGKFKRGSPLTHFLLNGKVEVIEKEDYSRVPANRDSALDDLEENISSLESDLLAMTN